MRESVILIIVLSTTFRILFVGEFFLKRSCLLYYNFYYTTSFQENTLTKRITKGILIFVLISIL